MTAQGVTDILQFFRDENIYDCEENSLEPLKQAIIVEIECLREDNQRLRAEVGELQQRCAEWREAYEDIAAERDRLRDVLTAILNSDVAMREEDEGRVSPELEQARAALGEPT